MQHSPNDWTNKCLRLVLFRLKPEMMMTDEYNTIQIETLIHLIISNVLLSKSSMKLGDM